MNTDTYVQRIARNYSENMVPLPEHLDFADEYRGGCPADRLRVALAGLHGWMAGVYRGAADSPGDFGLPSHPDLLPRSGSRYTASARAFEAIPAFVFGLGLCGVPQERERGACLQVDEECLAGYCREAGVKKVPALLDALGKRGLEVVPDAGTDGMLEVSFPDAPDIAFALPAFVRACCALTKKTGRPPLEFYRADVRVM